MVLTGNDIYQVQFLLPIQGNLKTLESVQQILDKANINEEDRGSEIEREIVFSDEEIIFLRNMIMILDESQKLSFSCLSLIKKILNYKE